MSAVKPVKPALTWEEVSQQLKNPRVNHKLDSDYINRLRIRAAYQKRKERRLKGDNKGRNIQDHSKSQVKATNHPARRSDPSNIPTSDAEKVADRKDALQPLKDNEASHHRKPVERRKSKMASDEENDAGSLLPSLDDGSRSAKGSPDVDTIILNSSRQNNGRLPSIDENQLVARSKKLQEETSRINSNDPTNIERRNSPDRRRRSENISKKISSLGDSTNSDRNEEKEEKEEKEENSHIKSIDKTNMENTNYPDHGKRNENISNRRSSPRTPINDDKDEEKEDKSTVENTNSPDHHKRKENTSTNQSSSFEAPSNANKDGDEHKNPNENPQKSKIKRPREKSKKPDEAPYAEKRKEDNRTGQKDERNQPDEKEKEMRQLRTKEPKRKVMGGKVTAASKPSYVDDELDDVVVKLERMVNRTLRALQGMKADDADDELDDLDQKTINRFIDGDRYQEIDAFLNS